MLQARNAGKVSGLALIDRRVLVRAVNQCELFLERHLAKQFVDPSVACNGWYGLRPHQSGAKEQNGDNEHGVFGRA